MGNKDGYKIRHNGVPRTFRDRKDAAYEAARFAKSRHLADIIWPTLLRLSNARPARRSSCLRMGGRVDA